MAGADHRQGTIVRADEVTLEAIRDLARVSARISAGTRLEDTLQAVADGLVDTLGFGGAAVNYGRPGADFVVVAVAGPEDAKRTLLGQVTRRDAMAAILGASERYGPLRYLGGSAVWDAIHPDDAVFWTPDGPEPGGPDEWQPDEMLLAPLQDATGALIGVLSLDLPPEGRRPGALLCELVGVFAQQAAAAIANARLTTELLDERERLRIERSLLASSEAALRFTFASSAAGMATVHLSPDRCGLFRDANDAFCQVVGYRHDELRLRRYADLVDEADRAAVEQAVMDAAEGLHGPGSIERRIVRGDGTAVWLEVMASVISAGVDHEPFLLLQVQDVTARRARHADLVAQAHEDPLTGLVNRRRLLEHLADVVTRARATGTTGALLYCDLDRFKLINDRYGHAMGDQALREVADRLRAAVRSADVVARFGGDEFVVVAEDLDETAVTGMIGRIRSAFAEPLECVPMTTDISVGHTVIDHLVRDPAELLHRGDVAMYGDKGRER